MFSIHTVSNLYNNEVLGAVHHALLLKAQKGTGASNWSVHKNTEKIRAFNHTTQRPHLKAKNMVLLHTSEPHTVHYELYGWLCQLLSQPEIQAQCICTKMSDYHILFCQCAASECLVRKKKMLQALSINFVMHMQMSSAWVAAVKPLWNAAVD
jgi:hypothetical protein